MKEALWTLAGAVVLLAWGVVIGAAFGEETARRQVCEAAGGVLLEPEHCIPKTQLLRLTPEEK